MSDIRLEDLLIAHAAGRLPEPVSVLVASHLALVPTSRRAFRLYEAVGGVLLEDLEPAPMNSDAIDRVVQRLDHDPAQVRNEGHEPVRAKLRGRDQQIPLPLAEYIPAHLDQLPWRRLGPVAEADIGFGCPDYRCRLIRLKAGRAVPKHSHLGTEMTLVLQGSFQDGTGCYARGDVALADEAVDHQPVAGSNEDCLCFAITDAPLRLTGRFTRFLNPFVRL